MQCHYYPLTVDMFCGAFSFHFSPSLLLLSFCELIQPGEILFFTQIHDYNYIYTEHKTRVAGTIKILTSRKYPEETNDAVCTRFKLKLITASKTVSMGTVNRNGTPPQTTAVFQITHGLFW